MVAPNTHIQGGKVVDKEVKCCSGLVAIFYHELEQPWALFVGQVPPPHDVQKRARWLGVFLPALPLQAILRNSEKSSPGSLSLDKMIVCTVIIFWGPCCFPWVMLAYSLRFLANWNASFHFQKETLGLGCFSRHAQINPYLLRFLSRSLKQFVWNCAWDNPLSGPGNHDYHP